MTTETSKMKIAILSGKGGTGKTLLSVNLAAVAQKPAISTAISKNRTGIFFFKPENLTEEVVTVKIPQVEPALCNACRQCVEFCRFNALAFIMDRPIVFEEVCHSCGGCSLVCPPQTPSARRTKASVSSKKASRGRSASTPVY